MITATEFNGKLAYQAEKNGTEYFMYRDPLGRYVVASQRKALKAARMGGTIRHFDTLEAVSAKIKAFAGIDVLAALV